MVRPKWRIQLLLTPWRKEDSPLAGTQSAGSSVAIVEMIVSDRAPRVSAT